MTTAHTTTPLKIPARELRKRDKIGMGTIADVEVTDKHVLIDFECRIGKHGTAFPLDLEVTVLSRAVTPDPAPDLTAPLLMAARGLKPGMAVIDDDGTTVHTVLSVVTEGARTTVEYVGGVKHVVSDIEGYRVTRLSSMAVYHARQAQRAVVAELTVLADTWETRAALLDKPTPVEHETVIYERKAQALEARTCAHQLRALIGRLA